MIRARLIAWSAVVVVATGGDARAHSAARSSLDARTDGDALSIMFRLDAASTEHAVGVPVTREAIAEYLAARFVVTGGGAACPLRPSATVRADGAQGVYLVGARYQCASRMKVVSMASTLFDDDPVPRPIVATFRHDRAVEHYVFTPAGRVASIDLASLRQSTAHSASERRFRTATPPAGAYSRSAPAGARRADPAVAAPAAADTCRSSFAGMAIAVLAMLCAAGPVLIHAWRRLSRRHAESFSTRHEEAPWVS